MSVLLIKKFLNIVGRNKSIERPKIVLVIKLKKNFRKLSRGKVTPQLSL